MDIPNNAVSKSVLEAVQDGDAEGGMKRILVDRCWS
jgi:hypothetical protein